MFTRHPGMPRKRVLISAAARYFHMHLKWALFFTTLRAADKPCTLPMYRVLIRTKQSTINLTAMKVINATGRISTRQTIQNIVSDLR